jgi:hypothetical protein
MLVIYFSRKVILFISFTIIAIPAFNQTLAPNSNVKNFNSQPASAIRIQNPDLVINPDRPVIYQQQLPSLEKNLNRSNLFEKGNHLNRNIKRKSVLLQLHSKPWKKRKQAVSGQILTGAIVAGAGIILLIVGGAPIYLIGSLLLLAGVVMIILDLVA